MSSAARVRRRKAVPSEQSADGSESEAWLKAGMLCFQKQYFSMVSTPLPGRPVRGSPTGRPIMAIFDLLGRRWTLRVLWELREGAAPRSATLAGALRRRVVERVAPTGCAELTEAGIVERGDGGYRLTADGRELMELLRPLGQWSQRWAARQVR